MSYFNIWFNPFLGMIDTNAFSWLFASRNRNEVFGEVICGQFPWMQVIDIVVDLVFEFPIS